MFSMSVMVRQQCSYKSPSNKSSSHCYQEGQRHRAQLSLSEVPVLAERRQVSWQCLSTRSPYPAQLSPPSWRSQAPRIQLALRPPTAGAGPSDCVRSQATTIRSQRQGTGERSTAFSPQGLSQGQKRFERGLWSPQDTAPAGPHLTQLIQGPREKARIQFLAHSQSDNHHSANCLLNGPLTAAH